MTEIVFVDTWGWLAIGHRKDSVHKKAMEFYQILCANNVDIVTKVFSWL